jgi:hypothetical protein
LADDKQRKQSNYEMDDDASGSAADDPTAVWDVETLRKAGLDELSKLEPTATPAVTAAVKSTGPSIVIDVQVDDAPAPAAANAPQAAGVKTPAPPPRKEMGWATTVGLAAGLGAVVYAIIRLLR